MPRNMRQHDIGIVASPRVPVTPAQPRRLDPDHHPVGLGHRIGHHPDLRRNTELLEDHGPHEAPPIAADKQDKYPLRRPAPPRPAATARLYTSPVTIFAT
jgi:hypothetical protein